MVNQRLDGFVAALDEGLAQLESGLRRRPPTG
jgi:hypothetical protein